MALWLLSLLCLSRLQVASSKYSFISSPANDYYQVLLVNQVLATFCGISIFLLLVYFFHGLYLESKDTSNSHDDMYQKMVKAAVTAMFLYLLACIGSVMRSNRFFYQGIGMTDAQCAMSYFLTWFGHSTGKFVNNVVLIGKFYMTFRDSVYGQRDKKRLRFCCCSLNWCLFAFCAIAAVAFNASILILSLSTVQVAVSNLSGATYCVPDTHSASGNLGVVAGGLGTTVELVISVTLLVLYFRRFKEITSQAGTDGMKKDDALLKFLRRNFVLATWTNLTTQLLIFVALVSPTLQGSIGVVVDCLINSICLALIFRFSSGMYERICAPSENCLVGLQHKSHDLVDGVTRAARAFSERTLSGGTLRSEARISLEAEVQGGTELPPIKHGQKASEVGSMSETHT